MSTANVIDWIGGGFVWGAPIPILFFALIAFLGFVFLRFTKQGQFMYAIGDNFAVARISGAPVRSVIVLQYTISALIAYVAGLITATAVSSLKVAILQGQPTSGSDSGMMKGVENAFSKHPEIKTVANVAGEWDATKAHAVISPVIQ